MTAPLLSVRGLVTEFDTPDGVIRAADGVSYDVLPGETVGVVGESGAGKTVAVMSVLGLLPQPSGRIVSGEALFAGRDLLRLAPRELRALRGAEIGTVFQDPMTSLNPVLTIGFQIAEAIRTHERVPDRVARRRSVELLASVGVPDAERRFDQYPHACSGGLRQRAMIAMAIANSPRLLIADEPTTALDVTIQAQVLEVLEAAQRQAGAATILVTHDLGLVAEMADRVVVMYGGRVVETGTVDEIFSTPRHPYTLGLLASLPRPDADLERLVTIPGTSPSLLNLPSGCAFHPRCRLAKGRARCSEDVPLLHHSPGGRASACHFHDEVGDELARIESQTGAAISGERP